jgi:hypothetical protein
MWIINSRGNLFNTDRLTCIDYSFGATYATADGKRELISSNPVVDKILEALKNGDNFVEVE